MRPGMGNGRDLTRVFCASLACGMLGINNGEQGRYETARSELKTGPN